MLSAPSPRLAALVAALGISCVMAACEQATAPSPVPSSPAAVRATAAVPYTVYATGLLFPRGLTFGNDGTLYVAEAGSGGSASTVGQCPQEYLLGPYTNGPTARISKVDRNGNRTTLASGFPSYIDIIGDVTGVADLAFQGGRLYALSSGGGCSHGSLSSPLAVVRVEMNGNWSPVANLGAYLAANPAAQPPLYDYSLEGTWYSMIKSGDGLVAIEPNHGELAKVNPRKGTVQRIVDLSASQGHFVPTAVAERKGAYYVGNLGIYPIVPGTQQILRVSRSGEVSVAATGFTTILGLDFDHSGRLYVLETSPVPGYGTPMTGRIVRVDRRGARDVIIDGLFFPTAMRFGPDGALYVSNKGFGTSQSGEILRVPVRNTSDDAGADMEP